MNLIRHRWSKIVDAAHLHSTRVHTAFVPFIADCLHLPSLARSLHDNPSAIQPNATHSPTDCTITHQHINTSTHQRTNEQRESFSISLAYPSMISAGSAAACRPSGRPVRLRPSAVPSLHHSITPSLHHSITPSFSSSEHTNHQHNSEQTTTKHRSESM